MSQSTQRQTGGGTGQSNLRTLPFLVAVLLVAVRVSGQEITLRVETREVVVPFLVIDELGTPQACPEKGDLTIRERGRVMPIRGVQTTSKEPIALGIVLSLDSGYSKTEQYDTRAAYDLAREVLGGDDGCIAVNATGFPDWIHDGRKWPIPRQSKIAEGRAGCLPFLQVLFEREAAWTPAGDLNGLDGYTWAGVGLALRALDRDPRLRRAIILFGKGIDYDHDGLPAGLQRQAIEKGIPIYSLYFPPDDRWDPKLLARWARFARTPIPTKPVEEKRQRLRFGLNNLKQVTQGTGGKLYEVGEDTIFPIAKEIVASLRQQCQLTYQPSADGAPGFRKIEVTIVTPGWKVRHRPGYYPEQAGQPSKP